MSHPNPTHRLPWFRFWPESWLGATAGLSSAAIALFVQLCARSWLRSGGGRLVERLESLGRITGLASTSCQQAIDELATAELIIVEAPAGTNDSPAGSDGELTLRVIFVEKEARRRKQQAEYASRRRVDSKSTASRHGIDSESTGEEERMRGREEKREKSAASGAADAPRRGVSLSPSPSGEEAGEDRASDVDAVLGYYGTSFHPSYRVPTRASSSDRRIISGLLRDGWPAADLKLALDAVHARPPDAKGRTFLRIDQIFETPSKTAELVEEGRRLAQGRKAASAPAITAAPEDKLCGDPGWKGWWRACKAKDVEIPMDATLAEWTRLTATRKDSVGALDVEDFVRRWKARKTESRGETEAESSAPTSHGAAAASSPTAPPAPVDDDAQVDARESTDQDDDIDSESERFPWD